MRGAGGALEGAPHRHDTHVRIIRGPISSPEGSTLCFQGLLGDSSEGRCLSPSLGQIPCPQLQAPWATWLLSVPCVLTLQVA